MLSATSVTRCTYLAVAYSSRTYTALCKSRTHHGPLRILLIMSTYCSPAPGAQAVLPRWSLAMFTRPGDSVVLSALTEESSMVAEAVANAADRSIFNSGQTSKEWFARRIKNQRSKNQKVSSYSYSRLGYWKVTLTRTAQGPETWRQSRGTEHRPEAA